MHDAGKIIFGLLIFLAIVTYPAWHNAMNGKTGYIPAPKAPPDKKECVEPKQVIRVIHKDLLADWKESVVRKGTRTYLSGRHEDLHHEPDRHMHELPQGQGRILRPMPYYMESNPAAGIATSIPRKSVFRL